MVTVLIVLFVVLLLILLAALPVPLRFAARLSLRTGRIRATARVLGVIPIRADFRLNLAADPYFTLQWLKKNGTVRTFLLFAAPQAELQKAENLFRLKRADAHILLGLKNDAALTVLTVGVLRAAGSAALPLLPVPVGLSVTPVFGRSLLRINLEGIGTLFPAKSIPILLKKK